MRQQHAVVGAAIPLPCKNERRRSLGAERECDVCRLGGRAAIDSVSHRGLTAWSEAARPRFLAFSILAAAPAALFGILAGERGGEYEREEVAKTGTDTNQRIWAGGRNGSSRHLTFFGTQFRAPRAPSTS